MNEKMIDFMAKRLRTKINKINKYETSTFRNCLNFIFIKSFIFLPVQLYKFIKSVKRNNAWE